MLKKAGGEITAPIGIKISQASFPRPFDTGLEYSPPARGDWNIVHMGLLIPQSHQIYFCAQGCLRGVVQTTAEMDAMDRLSWAYLCDEDYADGSMEYNIIDSVTQVIKRMKERPPCILVFLSCMHLFAGVDFDMIIDELEGRFGGIDFVKCYMTPTMRFSGLAPVPTMYRQMFVPLRECEKDGGVNIIGYNWAIDDDCELVRIIKSAGVTLRQLPELTSYAQYLEMARSDINITIIPEAAAAAADLEQRLGQKHLYLPVSWDPEKITDNYQKLCEQLGIQMPDLSQDMAQAKAALENAAGLLDGRPVAVDFMAAHKPFELCRLLLEHGFNVTRLFVDVISGEDEQAFEFIRRSYPEFEIYPTVNSSMRFFASSQQTQNEYLAIGQKAAYFCCTDHFVDIVGAKDMYGFDGIKKLAAKIIDAAQNPKDRKTVIQHKGMGCQSCL